MWPSIDTVRHTKLFLPKSKKHIGQFIWLKIWKTYRGIVGVLTGHNLLDWHMFRKAIIQDDTRPPCNEESMEQVNTPLKDASDIKSLGLMCSSCRG